MQGQRIAIDATTLEANAAMRSIVRRDTGASYDEFLTGLAKASGIETPTATDDRTGPHRTSRSGSRRTRRSPPPPAVRSAADKTDVPAQTPAPCAQSTNPLASPVACASPSPCADSTNTPCESTKKLSGYESALAPRAASHKAEHNSRQVPSSITYLRSHCTS